MCGLLHEKYFEKGVDSGDTLAVHEFVYVYDLSFKKFSVLISRDSSRDLEGFAKCCYAAVVLIVGRKP